jgi:hypothetical protein
MTTVHTPNQEAELIGLTWLNQPDDLKGDPNGVIVRHAKGQELDPTKWVDIWAKATKGFGPMVVYRREDVKP